MGVYVYKDGDRGHGCNTSRELKTKKKMFTAIALVFKYITLRITLNC